MTTIVLPSCFPRSRAALVSLSLLVGLPSCAAATEAPVESDEAAWITAPPAPSGPASAVSTRCQVSAARYLSGTRYAYLERPDQGSCRPDSASYPRHSLSIGAPGIPRSAEFTGALDGFAATPDGSRLVVFLGNQWRILDGASGAPLGPWRRGPHELRNNMPYEDGIVSAQISPTGKRVLLAGTNTGWFVFAVEKAEELRVAPSASAGVYGSKVSQVAFVSDERLVVSSLELGPPWPSRNTGSLVERSAKLELVEIGPVSAPARLPARATWTFDAPQLTVDDQHRSTPHGTAVSFGSVTVDPTGSYILTGGGDTSWLPVRAPEIRSAATGAVLTVLPTRPMVVGDASFSADGKRVVLAPSPSLRVFETLTGKIVHEEIVQALDATLSPDGKTLAKRMQIRPSANSSVGASIVFVPVP